MSQPILALQELSKFYVNGQNVVAGLNKVTLSFEQGEFVAITGESGSGKSTLAHILGGILPYEDGELLLDGKPTSHFDSVDWERYRAESVGFISQSYGILPGATVQENVVSALRLTGMEKEEAIREAHRILEEVELLPLRHRRAAKLSSGQKQRLSIARALAKPCRVLIADEPTGNLDPENSDKVIRLLAKAAQDRLVILITHDFYEAEDYVTRHITLQDGRLSADAHLRPNQPEAQAPQKRANPRDLSGYIASVQLRSRPAWSAIVLLFVTITAFAVFTFLGSFIVALDDTPTRVYESSAFLNGEKDRIVAVRTDLQPMTRADYDAILSIRYVESLDKFGYIQDICYAYRENQDYVLNYTRHNHGTRQSPAYIELATPSILSTDQFMQTVPVTKNEDFLTSGRLPQQFNEVVAADASLLGKTVTVYLSNERDWPSGSFICLDVTVVGTTGRGEGLYFHDDVGRTLTLDYLGGEFTYIPYYQQIPTKSEYVNYRDARSKIMYGPHCMPFHTDWNSLPGSTLRDLQDTEIIVSHGAYTGILEAMPTAGYSQIYRHDFAAQTGTYHVAGLHGSSLDTLIAVTPAVFGRILTESGIADGNQVSITIRDYAYAQRVIDDLADAGYYALSPYILGATSIDEDLAAQRYQTLLVCILALLAIAVLQLIVLRAMFGMETESYRILSDMGLTCRCARKSLLWQMLLFAAAGQLLALLAVLICSALGVSQIADLTKYLYGWWWVVISLVHLATTLLAIWLAAAALKKRVYPRTAVFRDLIIDEEAAQ
ncbi:MAG: ABC transporter ATP-binding protein [Oscillospiraceae bacterium]|nr:ABC transporter ATP-binding protein [Oscillospiraceae bacterium]